jgi:hypothetical protein
LPLHEAKTVAEATSARQVLKDKIKSGEYPPKAEPVATVASVAKVDPAAKKDLNAPPPAPPESHLIPEAIAQFRKEGNSTQAGTNSRGLGFLAFGPGLAQIPEASC